MQTVPPDQANVRRIVIRAPPGAKFSFWGNDMYLEFQKGEELRMVNFMQEWTDNYVKPVAQFYLNEESDNQNQLTLEKEKDNA